MIRNEVKLIGRLTANPELKYTKETNKALCNVVLAVNSIYSNEAGVFAPCLLEQDG